AEFVQRLEHANLVSLLHQIASHGKPGGTTADDSNLFPSRRSIRHGANTHALLVVRYESLQVADPERLNFLSHQAAALAVVFLRTDAASDRRQNVVFPDLGGGAQKIARHDHLHEFMHLDADGTVLRTRRLGALDTAQGFLPGKFLAIAEIYFGELGCADFWRLLRHVLPRQLHAVLDGHRIQRWLGRNGHWVTPFAAQTPFPSASVFLRCDSSARRYSARDCCS